MAVETKMSERPEVEELETLLSDKTLEHYERWLDSKFRLPEHLSGLVWMG